MRPSRKFLRLLTALSFAGGVTLLALGAQVSLRAHLGASAAALSALGALVALLSALGFVGAGRDKSALLMLFFFLSFLLVASLFVACYAAFFFQDALKAWLKHHWAARVLRHLRALDDCVAFEACADYLERRVVQLGAVGAALVVLALAEMYCVVRIVTVPIVMKSMLTFVNAVFVALGAGIFAYGLAVKVHADMTSGQQWIGTAVTLLPFSLYGTHLLTPVLAMATALILIVVGTVLVALSVLGVIGARAKNRTLLLIVGYVCVHWRLAVHSLHTDAVVCDDMTVPAGHQRLPRGAARVRRERLHAVGPTGRDIRVAVELVVALVRDRPVRVLQLLERRL